MLGYGLTRDQPGTTLLAQQKTLLGAIGKPKSIRSVGEDGTIGFFEVDRNGLSYR